MSAGKARLWVSFRVGVGLVSGCFLPLSRQSPSNPAASVGCLYVLFCVLLCKLPHEDRRPSHWKTCVTVTQPITQHQYLPDISATLKQHELQAAGTEHCLAKWNSTCIYFKETDWNVSLEGLPVLTKNLSSEQSVESTLAAAIARVLLTITAVTWLDSSKRGLGGAGCSCLFASSSVIRAGISRWKTFYLFVLAIGQAGRSYFAGFQFHLPVFFSALSSLSFLHFFLSSSAFPLSLLFSAASFVSLSHHPCMTVSSITLCSHSHSQGPCWLYTWRAGP